MKLPKWDGESKPPRHHVWGHRVLGPPVAFAFALWDAVHEARSEYVRSYRAFRSWHADRWYEAEKGEA